MPVDSREQLFSLLAFILKAFPMQIQVAMPDFSLKLSVLPLDQEHVLASIMEDLTFVSINIKLSNLQ
jgi:hypothetical protein